MAPVTPPHSRPGWMNPDVFPPCPDHGERLTTLETWRDMHEERCEERQAALVKALEKIEGILLAVTKWFLVTTVTIILALLGVAWTMLAKTFH